VARRFSGISRFWCADSPAAVICGDFDYYSLLSTQNSGIAKTLHKNSKLDGGFQANRKPPFLFAITYRAANDAGRRPS
jgi:hypothetical protein